MKNPKYGVIVLAAVFITRLPLLAQTNQPVSFLVEVPSITISFPDSMTLSQIDDALKTHFGTNLTFTFSATNKLTHERVRFTGNSMPNSNELEQLFAWQRQNDAAKDKTHATNAFADLIPASQSDTLTAFRKKYPQFANIPDSQVVLTIGKNLPTYLQQDKRFAEEFAAYSAAEIQSSASDSNNGIEERKATALERQADALERQANALEDQTPAQERAADAAEDQAFQQEMLNDDIDFRLDTLQIQNMTRPTLPTVPVAPIQQPDHPRFIIVPGQGTYVVSPERLGQPQIITGPGLNGPIIVSP
jgi:hypothetical protein